MKRVLVLVFLLMSVMACHRHSEVSLLKIISVSGLTDVEVAFGTDFQTIQLPNKVAVTYSDNSTEEVSVTFSQGSYTSTTPGTYTLEGILTLTNGTINDQDLKAAINIIVLPAVVPAKNITSVNTLDDIKVAYGKEFLTISLPNKVSVTYSDNSAEELSVAFGPGSYSNTLPGTYSLEGTLTLKSGTTNTLGLKAAIKLIVAPLKLKTVSLDGSPLYEYFYDAQNRLDHYKVYSNNTDYYYTYSADNKVTQRLRKLAGNDYPEKYFYHNDGTLDRIEFYYGSNTLDQTHTYTYQNGKILKYDNSDQSINGLKSRTFEYDGQGNISKVSFDFGSPWNYTYFNNKKVLTPLILDLANPLDQNIHPVDAFNYVLLSSYTATYTYNAWGYPTQEVRTFPGNGNSQTTYAFTYE